MHPSFADWYRPLLTQPDEKFLKSRWDLVEATATNLSIPLALELLRLSFGLPIQDDEAIAELKKQLKPEGMNYARATANLELALLGDCILLQSFGQAKSRLLWSHITIACSLVCQQALRPTIQRTVQQQLIQEARMLVDSYSVQSRKLGNLGWQNSSMMPEWPEVSDPPTKINEETQQQAVTGTYVNTQVSFKIPRTSQLNQLVATVQETKRSISTITSTLDKFASVADDILSKINTSIAAPQEENNIHWYLLGETSRDLQRRFASFDIEELTLIAAKELADLTENVPGLYAALGFLDRILSHGRPPNAAEQPLGLERAIAAAQQLWKTKGIQVVGFDATQDLTPILSALGCATTSDEDWRSLIPQLCRVDLGMQLPPVLLSYQLYQEILLSRLARQQLGQKGTK